VPGRLTLQEDRNRSKSVSLFRKPIQEVQMKKLIAAICFTLAAAPLALAQDKATDAAKKAAPAAEKSAKKEPSAKQKAQQEKMKACSKEASGKKLKGDERKKFMSGCMKG
jgi:ribosomal protein L12E/L44/L45/RPP1/RPP2